MVFDLDDTLCDYRAARVHGLSAVRQALEVLGIQEPPFADRFARISHTLKADLDAGVIDRETYDSTRFLEAVGGEPAPRHELASALRVCYHAAISESLGWVPGGPEAFAKVLQRYDVAVLTNGSRENQCAKLARLGIAEAVGTATFVSDDIGVAKPDRGAFEFVLRRLGVHPRAAVMVGDSIDKDLEPALALGMRGVLLAPAGAPAGWSGNTIRGLRELPRVLDMLSSRQLRGDAAAS